MTKGFVLIAQNSEYDYVQQACALAMSIQATNEAKICLITNDKVPSKYEKLFDVIKHTKQTTCQTYMQDFITLKNVRLQKNFTQC